MGRCASSGRPICTLSYTSGLYPVCSTDVSLGRLQSSAEGTSTVLRMIDFFKIPREHGDCVVLIVAHPGPNLLGRYLPASKVNDLLLADPNAIGRPSSSSSHGDLMMHSGFEDPDLVEELEPTDTMDLASFLEYAICSTFLRASLNLNRFAIKATQCLQTMHT